MIEINHVKYFINSYLDITTTFSFEARQLILGTAIRDSDK